MMLSLSLSSYTHTPLSRLCVCCALFSKHSPSLVLSLSSSLCSSYSQRCQRPRRRPRNSLPLGVTKGGGIRKGGFPKRKSLPFSMITIHRLRAKGTRGRDSLLVHLQQRLRTISKFAITTSALFELQKVPPLAKLSNHGFKSSLSTRTQHTTAAGVSPLFCYFRRRPAVYRKVRFEARAREEKVFLFFPPPPILCPTLGGRGGKIK